MNNSEIKKNSFFKEYVPYLVLGVILGLLMHSVFSLTKVNGLSMYSTLNNGDVLLMNKIPKYTNSIDYGDIVIFNSTPNETNMFKKVFYIKRVIAKAGDHIIIQDGKVIVNDNVLSESYIDDLETLGYVNMTVPKGKYYVLGDNRDGSSDSRDFGTIDHSQLEGVAVLRLLPLGKFSIN